MILISKRKTVRSTLLLCSVAIGILLGSAGTASAQFIGDIVLVPYNFAMRNYMDCSGQTLPISSNTALFSIIGTMYGGNGTTTFSLPNLNNKIPIGQGQGPGLSNYSLGQTGGSPTVTLLANQIPAHSHLVSVDTNPGTTSSPAGAFFASHAAGVPSFNPSPNSVMFHSSAVSTAGGGQPHNNWQPYLGLKWVICVSGVYPSRP